MDHPLLPPVSATLEDTATDNTTPSAVRISLHALCEAVAISAAHVVLAESADQEAKHGQECEPAIAEREEEDDVPSDSSTAAEKPKREKPKDLSGLPPLRSESLAVYSHMSDLERMATDLPLLPTEEENGPLEADENRSSAGRQTQRG